MITGLDHIALIGSDRDRSVRFYEALGFRICRTLRRPERGDEILWMECAGVTLELFISDDPGSHPERVTDPEAKGLRHLALRVDDLEEMVGSLRASGYSAEPVRLDSVNGKKVTFIKGPDGEPVELHE